MYYLVVNRPRLYIAITHSVQLLMCYFVAHNYTFYLHVICITCPSFDVNKLIFNIQYLSPKPSVLLKTAHSIDRN